MSNLPVITVRSLGELPKGTSLYLGTVTDERMGIECYRMLKFDSLGNCVNSYTITGKHANPKKTVCSCPAYIDNCRHKRMLRHIIRNGGLNSTTSVIGMHNKAMSWYNLPEPLIDPDLLGDT